MVDVVWNIQYAFTYRYVGMVSAVLYGESLPLLRIDDKVIRESRIPQSVTHLPMCEIFYLLIIDIEILVQGMAN